MSRPNYEEDKIIVSATEPIGNNRRKVWILRSENLFDKNNYNLFKGYIDSTTLQWIQNDNGNFIYLKVKPNTTYTVSRKIVASQFAVATGIDVPNAGQTASSFKNGEGEKSVTITTGANDNYLYIYVLWNQGNTVTINEVIDSLSVVTGKSIHVRNDNDVYEEIYDENKVNKKIYSTEEHIVGKWIDGKTLYRRTLTGNYGTNEDTLILPKGNIDFLIVKNCIARMNNGTTIQIPYGNHTFDWFWYFDNEGLKLQNIHNESKKPVDLLFGQPYWCIVEYTKTTD